jgi:hypothetical protein
MLTSRRQLIDLALRAAALPGGAEFMTAFLRAGDTHVHAAASSAPADAGLLRDYKPRFFDATDFDALRAFTEILIPSDETPGAREAHCAEFIDFLLQSAGQAPGMQKQWRDGMALLREIGFHTADARGRAALVEEMSRPERDHAATHRAYPVYRMIKQQNTFAFYTSRAGMIETLDYKGNSYNEVFPACDHPEHHVL